MRMITKIETQKRYTDFSESSKKLLLDRISNPSRVLIISHKNPDGDAIGSALGLGRVLESCGHQVKVFLPDDAPDFLKWMPGYSHVATYERSAKSFPGFSEDPDLVFFVDFNTPERLGEMASAIDRLSGFKVLVDHHPGYDPFYDLALVDTSRGSTSEMIFLLLEDMGLLEYIDKEAATCLYSGIITDTLGLQVGSSYPEVFRVVGRLIESGIKMHEVFDNLYSQFSANRMQLLGYCLAEKLILMPDYKVAYIWITKEELARFHHIKGDTEGFVNYPLTIKDIQFTVLFTELDGEIKLSLRSKGDIPVNEFAASFFQGGGHLNAAGGRSQLSMHETLDRFEELVKQFMTIRLYQE